LPPETNPDFVVNRQLEGEELLQAIDQLSETQRSVIILRFGEGLTAPQVANILDKTEEAVRALQRRGLANLRRHYAATASKSTASK
jgi:RNA polymerase sigma-70 factor (ECF subfamily)